MDSITVTYFMDLHRFAIMAVYMFFANNFVISCPINTEPNAFYRKFRGQHLSHGRRNTRDFEHAKCGEVCHPIHPIKSQLRWYTFWQAVVSAIWAHSAQIAGALSRPPDVPSKNGQLSRIEDRKNAFTYFFSFPRNPRWRQDAILNFRNFDRYLRNGWRYRHQILTGNTPWCP